MSDSDLDIDPSLAPSGEAKTVAEELAGSEPAAEPAVEAVVDPAEDPAAEPAPEPEPEKKYHGAVAELVQKRKEAKEEKAGREAAETRLRAYEDAVRDGRLIQQAPKPKADVDRERLTKTAERLNLYSTDAAGNRLPDLDAAARVDSYIRDAVREKVAPDEHMTLWD